MTGLKAKSSVSASIKFSTGKPIKAARRAARKTIVICSPVFMARMREPKAPPSRRSLLVGSNTDDSDPHLASHIEEAI